MFIQVFTAGSKFELSFCRGAPAVTFGRSAELNKGSVLVAFNAPVLSIRRPANASQNSVDARSILYGRIDGGRRIVGGETIGPVECGSDSGMTPRVLPATGLTAVGSKPEKLFMRLDARKTNLVSQSVVQGQPRIDLLIVLDKPGQIFAQGGNPLVNVSCGKALP